MKHVELTLIAFLILALTINVAYATNPDAVNLNDLPHQLGEALGVSDFVGGLITTGILILLFVLPIAILVKGKTGNTILLIIAFLTMGVSVSLGWLSVWIMMIICLLVALGYAARFKDMI